MQDHGILGPKTILGHCIHVNSAEMDLIHETGVMDYKPFTPFSDENIDGHTIFGMTGRQCQTTIAGKLLMLDRELVGIDEKAENAHIFSSWARAGPGH